MIKGDVGCRISNVGKTRPVCHSRPIALNFNNTLSQNVQVTMIRQLFYSSSCKQSFGNDLRSLINRRSFAATHPIWVKKMPDRPSPVREDEFTESYLKGSGPGGQKIVSQRRE